MDKEAHDYAAYELKNNFLHHVEELLIMGRPRMELVNFIRHELQDSIYQHLFDVFALRLDLSPIDEAVRKKDANSIVEQLIPIAKQHKRRRQILRITRPLRCWL